MVVSKFSENFWGDKLNGFDILCQNLKYSLTNVKDLENYFRECANIEDQYTKLLSKVVMQTNKYSINGTFYPFWSPIKELNERIIGTHSQFMHHLQELIKEVNRYHDDLAKKIKRIRDNESQTQIVVQNFLEITQALNKSKEQYHNVAIELEKQKRAENTNVQKLEKKLKQSYDEYKLNVDRYNSIRNDYERKFTDSCTNFQLAEDLHLKQMKTYIDTYSKQMLNSNNMKQQIYEEFYSKTDSLQCDQLVQTFIDNKRTGCDRPEPASIIEPDFSKLPITTTTATAAASSNANATNTSAMHSHSNTPIQFNDEFNLFLNSNVTTPTGTISSTNGHTSSNMNATNNFQLLTNAFDSLPIASTNNNLVSASTASTQSNVMINSSNMNLFQTSTNSSITNMPLLINASSSALNTQANTSSSSTSSSSNDNNNNNAATNNMRRSDSKGGGFNIFNVDILGRNKSKNKNDKTKASSSIKQAINRKKKDSLKDQQLPQQQQQPPQIDLIQINTTVSSGGKDGNSSHSDDLSDSRVGIDNYLTTSSTGRTGVGVASSLDLFDPSKFSHGSDIDSEGFSIRPEIKKDNDDMVNKYSASDSSDESDSEPEIGVGPSKVMVTIKPKEEVEKKTTENPDVLREIGKNLQLKPLQPIGGLNVPTTKRRNYYSFGTANYNQLADQSSNSLQSNWPTSPSSATTSPPPPPTTQQPQASNTNMPRSISFGGNSLQANAINDLKFTPTNDFGKQTQLNTSIKLDSNLYNIDEDKEVEHSFQGNQKTNQKVTVPTLVIPPPPSSAPSIPGRFTPACFPGRTTPDFRHTTSLFENSTRAITSPLTLNGYETIPIAIAFNETIHAYFKQADAAKFKIKCFGCMKISFPFAILKFLSMELPQLEFSLQNLQIQNQDLIINDQLITKKTSNNELQSMQFGFNTPNLINELKEQHQSNKQAAFFNFELLKYELKYVDAPPLLLNSYWKKTIDGFDDSTELEFVLDYSCNCKKALTNVHFMLVLHQQPANYQLSLIKSEPQAQINTNEQKLQILWQFQNVNTSGRLIAKLKYVQNKLDENNSSTNDSNFIETICQQPLYVKFHIDNATLSNVKFDILSQVYKLSLLREKIETGKYFCTPSLSSDIANDNDGQNTTTNSNTNTTTTTTTTKASLTGQVSTHIGSTADILLI